MDHYQLRREFDIYVAPNKEDLSRVNKQVAEIVGQYPGPMALPLRSAERFATWTPGARAVSFRPKRARAAVPAPFVCRNPYCLNALEAEKMAIANNPRIRIRQLLARVQHEVVRERRADELPSLNGDVTGVAAEEGSRISGGSLTAARLLNHAGAGVQLSQLIADFGRTSNLVATAKLREKARLSHAEASKQEIVLATDQFFYQVIEAQEALKVADQTVSATQNSTDQVAALASSKLRSELDLSFAQVSLSQAKLLTLDAQNNLDAAKAALNAVLGLDQRMQFILVDDSSALPSLPPDPDALISQAMQNRPDLEALRLNEQAAGKFSKAQRDQLPSIYALGVVGSTDGSSTYFIPNWYGAVGANVSIPILNFSVFPRKRQKRRSKRKLPQSKPAHWASRWSVMSAPHGLRPIRRCSR